MATFLRPLYSAASFRDGVSHTFIEAKTHPLKTNDIQAAAISHFPGGRNKIMTSKNKAGGKAQKKVGEPQFLDAATLTAALDREARRHPRGGCDPDAEFLDAAALTAKFGIKRSLAYLLLAEGSIKGVSLRRRGQLRGKRLFAVDSVREFLRAQMEADQK
jgi:hypothetical protein